MRLKADSSSLPQKRDLGSHVRDVLSARYGSMAVAAEKLEFSYERLKKAVQRSSFSAQDLEILLPGKTVTELKHEYNFNFSRRADLSVAPTSAPLDLLKTIEAGFRSFQRGVRDIDFTHFVDDLYDNIGPSLAPPAMTLFCDRTSQPLEWSSDQGQLMKSLAHALGQGAIVLYVMETDLIGTVRSDDIEYDDLDRQFVKYLDRLDRLRDDEADGFVALIRVRKCAFCTPFQKPSLFSCIPSNDSQPARHYALTTVDVPEQSSGEGHLGTAVLPQTQAVANAMREFLSDLVLGLQQAEPLSKADFHFTASHRRGERSELPMLIEKLDLISRNQ
jgi:hypothetical protein